MPSNAVTIYCGNSFSRELEIEFKERARDVAYALTRGRNQLGLGAYGKAIGRPPGVSMAEAILAVLQGRPDALEAIFSSNPNGLKTMIELFMENPVLAAAIVSGVASSSGEAATVAQEITEVQPSGDIEITDEIMAELEQREATVDERLRRVKLPSDV